MEEEIHDLVQDFCKMLVLLKGTDIFLLFLRGLFEISLIKGGIESCIYEGTLNNTYKCAYIYGLISQLILLRTFSNFQQIKTTCV